MRLQFCPFLPTLWFRKTAKSKWIVYQNDKTVASLLLMWFIELIKVFKAGPSVCRSAFECSAVFCVCVWGLGEAWGQSSRVSPLDIMAKDLGSHLLQVRAFKNYCIFWRKFLETHLMITQTNHTITCFIHVCLVLFFRRWTGLCLSSRLTVKSCTFQKRLQCIWVCHRWEFNMKSGSVQGHSDNTLQHTHNRDDMNFQKNVIISGECEVNSIEILFAPYRLLCFYWEIQTRHSEVWKNTELLLV